ncbi:MAG: response regulator receiver sensor signal transduction histidine kinase [Candidatus Magnetoglobus multicellularis str. Araruama]|uniref:histidine kinase n=1 Tax=Candidatus Magnetoglobus multicellularis str. Araruama TaxID=890399 RepID=A0A1V1PIG9_9BACT|nr:MAG: response regulator receiver sensor signal transduction histidine kinase [Candidatus Magnetoglobus multicellularis str. Araruama]
MLQDAQETILIVDDNLVNLRVMIQHLAEAGYETRIAQDGHEAIEQLKIALPDIILLDIMMPGIDGFETCAKIKEIPSAKNIPVIFMTALSETEHKVKGLKLGAVDYITKPFQQEEVLTRINTHLTIRRQQEALHHLNAAKDRFFSIIAHDLRGVFNPMMISTDMMIKIANQEESPKMIKFATALKKSTHNAYELLENLLTWSRCQRGNITVSIEKMEIQKVIESNINLFAEKASQKDIDLSHSVTHDIFVYADRNITDTILRNLIANALKFTNLGGHILVNAEKTQEHVAHISVQDDGTGIDPEGLESLFKIDSKYKKKGTANEQGTGLGLILCKELALKNHGDIWVSSEPDQGSTFTFSLGVDPNRI